MQVTAYKDPVTGLLFEDEGAYKKFMANRRREEEAQRVRAEALAQAETVRQTLCRELETLEQFPALATKMYEHVFKTATLRRGKQPVEVREIRVRRWSLSTSLRLSLVVDVVLSGQVERVYKDPFLRVTPTDVLFPFQLDGGGHGEALKDGGYRHSYGMAVDLDRLPKLLKTFQQAAQLKQAQLNHEREISSEVERALKEDDDFGRLQAAANEARRQLEAAQTRLNEAYEARSARSLVVTQEVRERMPFAQQAEFVAQQKTIDMAATAHYELLCQPAVEA